ncbi:putative polysaccharide export protein, partial [Trichodelitschia bisporula]
MLYMPFRRSRSRRARLRNAFVFLFLAWNVVEVLHVRWCIRTSEAKASRVYALSRTDKAGSRHHSHGHHRHEHSPTPKKRIYIASQLWNSAHLMHTAWNAELLALIRDLGVENVYLTILESGSYDDTKEVLTALDADLETLGVRRTVTMEDESHADLIAQPPGDEGWVTARDGTPHMRRIPFLAKLRNRTLEPLRALWEEGERFDLVLFLGDVVFTPQDVHTLLSTNSGTYAAACALDFSHPPLFYDSFATRDASASPHLMQTWPYFRSAVSRAAIKRGEPVPVASCWNGLVVMPAAPFATGDLGFRALPDKLAGAHLEASECCLVHGDNPLKGTAPVLMNPVVRVGYSMGAYEAVHDAGGGAWLSAYEIWVGLWANRVRRWVSWGFGSDSGRQMAVLGRLRREVGRTGVGEGVGWCVVDEMQVLESYGWRHV